MGRTMFRSFACLSIAALLSVQIAAQSHKLSSKESYEKFIEPLLSVPDFGVAYYEDGAADATVTVREDNEGPHPPIDAVLSILRLRSRAFPMLIDCLSDGRLTSVQFDGNTITQAMKVPVGYVCLDILMAATHGPPVWDPSCEGDGLGACVNVPFYFRPDDYWQCYPPSCIARPWVLVVQRNWRRQYLAHRLHFHSIGGFFRGLPEWDRAFPVK